MGALFLSYRMVLLLFGKRKSILYGGIGFLAIHLSIANLCQMMNFLTRQIRVTTEEIEKRIEGT